MISLEQARVVKEKITKVYKDIYSDTFGTIDFSIGIIKQNNSYAIQIGFTILPDNLKSFIPDNIDDVPIIVVIVEKVKKHSC